MTSDKGTGRQRRRLTATVTDLEVRRQRALLVGVEWGGMATADAERSLDELALLTETAGPDPVDRELVRRAQPDPGLFLGKGKAGDLSRLTKTLDIDVVIFDNELTPAQQRNLNELFGCDVVDREGLILDIFAQHATSKEGTIQVELALYRYNLPRLRGMGGSLSQQGAGVLARGPGETKLETDRRRILQRIARLERELASSSRHRHTQRKARRSSNLPAIAIVGYTNAGKSTLLNTLTNSEVLAADQLFATLDSTVRRLELADGRAALISDTVGFVRRLPHQLVEAFRSTLAEVSEADLLLHVVDASDTDPEGQIAAVREVLAEIDAIAIRELLVLNKSDIADPLSMRRLQNLHPEAVTISAMTGEGLSDLQHAVTEMTRPAMVTLTLDIPYQRGDVAAAAHRAGEVLTEKHDEEGTILEVRVPARLADGFAAFVR